ncbi:unnamed protein product [Cladocopium goreaui]|uniref:Retinol dehydrogenase 14 n=1 Tax=Cladocopium goreaui TaxID=2562237 RepID=A0A9P1DW21_9DINO|nr:unnamed protein product [Cladocopium goreaui]
MGFKFALFLSSAALRMLVSLKAKYSPGLAPYHKPGRSSGDKSRRFLPGPLRPKSQSIQSLPYRAAAITLFALARRGRRGPMPTCRLELMGIHDSSGYQRHARGLLQKAQSAGVLSGLNIPNKKPGEPLIEWAGILVKELPGVEVTVHYSLKHQRSSNSAEAFHEWCMDAARVGVRRVLLVTGPNGPRHDAVRVLQQLGRPVSGLRYGVAFNACLPSEAAREAERQRLVQKLRTGVVQDVWLNTGVDEDLLREGIQFVRETSTRLGVQVELFASAMLPSVAQLQQMRERPWNGVQFSEEFLSSLRGMAQATSKALDVFRDNGVEPIVESKARP